VSSKLRIVHFDQMFHPEFGDQINVLPKFQVKQGHEVYIVTGKNDVPHPRFEKFADISNMEDKDTIYEKTTGVKIIRIDIKTFISGRAVFSWGYKRIIDSLNPDILFVHFNDTLVGMHFTLISKRLNYPIVLDSHMLEMASVNRFNKLFRQFYKRFITPFIVKNKLKVIKTQEDDYVNNHLGIPYELTPHISFGSDTSLFYPSQKIRNDFRKKNQISNDDFVVIYTGKLSKDKGGKLLAEAFREKYNIKKNVVLIAVGNANSNYEKEVEILFEKSENRVIRFPTQKYIDLPKFYQSADLSVFPKQSSLSFYDAQATGLPVILEDNSLNIRRTKFNNGLVFKSGNPLDLRKKIIKIAEMSKSAYETMSRNAYYNILNNYDYEKIAQEYSDLMISEYNRFHNISGS